MNFNKIFICSLTKTGSSTLHKNIPGSEHMHSFERFKRRLNENTHCLFINTVRNPINMNLSRYLHELRSTRNKIDPMYDDVKMKVNNYKGIECRNLMTENEFKKLTFKQQIDYFFKQNFLYIFLDWYKEFFIINNIKNISFNKNKGYTIYNLKNNNKLLIITIEKLDKIKPDLKKLFNIKINGNMNVASSLRGYTYYNTFYNKLKKNIKYSNNYVNKLLDNEYIKYFYTENDIKNMKKQINII